MAQVSREEAARRVLHEEILRTAGRRGPVDIHVTVEDVGTDRTVRVDTGTVRTTTTRKEAK